MTNYQTFLESKKFVLKNSGIAVAENAINPVLYPFQRDLTRWSLRKGRCALFEDCGLGKTFQQLEWARLIDKRTLIIAPLSVAKQTVREGRKIDLDVHYTRSNDDLIDGINITNYEMIDQFDPSDFEAVVLDECFPADTMIDTPSGLKRISEIQIGDSIFNAQGEDYVKSIYKRQINRAVHVKTNDRTITCSENHPFFTLHGWRCAQDLQPGDYLMETTTAMRLVWGNISLNIGGQVATILREILFSEMENEYSTTQSQSSYQRSSCEDRQENLNMATFEQSNGYKRIGTNQKLKSNERSCCTSESIIPIAGDEPQTFRAWGQWDWLDNPSTDFTGCSWRRLDSGICYIAGKTDSPISNLLQSGLRESRAKNRYRSGWKYTLQPEGQGQEEGFKTGFIRVDSVEILEQGHPGLEKYRDGEGHVYFYDIKAIRHPSFSVNGLLVHNSSILKGLDGKTRQKLTEMFADTPYKLCCTATPAPNDIIEIANHAEFLGIMTRANMLATFFVHDDKGWRLKKHAVNPFYRWLASWAMAIRFPSDLGYSDEGFILPELRIIPDIIEVDYRPPDQLFWDGQLKGIQDRAKVRKTTQKQKVEEAARLIDGDSDQWIAWCGLNSEATMLHNLIPDSINVEGSMSPEEKQEALEAFQDGQFRVLVTKCKIAGFGMNFQNCHKMAFVGLGDSYELYYQAIRRCYRFGQKYPVEAHIVITNVEQGIYNNVLRKEKEAGEMSKHLIENVKEFEKAEIQAISMGQEYATNIAMQIPNWLGGIAVAG